jgi:hydrogenase expression/formation protein HypD
LEKIHLLILQKRDGTPKMKIEYSRVVHKEGNTKALKILNEAYSVSDAKWRGFGTIPNSGLVLKDELDLPPKKWTHS